MFREHDLSMGADLRDATWGAEPAGIGVYSWNPVTEELSWDDRLAQMFAADRPGESPFETWDRRVHPDDRASTEAAFADFPEGAFPEHVSRIVLDDGTVRHLLSRITDVVRDKDGTVVTAQGVMVDVTSAREADGRLVAMLDSISDGFCLFERDFTFAFVNRQGERILQKPAAEILGSNVWELFPGAVGTRFDEVYHRVMEERVAERFEEFYPEPLNCWFEVRAEPAVEGIVVYFQDINERRARREERERLLEAERSARHEADRAHAAAERSRAELAYQATHDHLTGLVNRGEFARLAQEALDDAQQAGGTGDDAARSVTVLFMDLDRFKLVNDSLGHAVGDQLLVRVGERLSRQLRCGDVLARQGGDEFVVLLRDVSPSEAQQVAERMCAVAREPFDVVGHSLSITLSIGIAAASAGATVGTLLRDADVALYRAKDASRDTSAWFDTDSHHELLDRVALESDLREALATGELEVHYQPSFTMDGHRLRGVEALSRWTHPRRGLVSPCVFIPVAEESGLIRDLGRRVLETACRQAVQWKKVDDFTVWVNVSGLELVPGYAASVLELLALEGLPTHRIGIEVTESVLANETVAARELTLLHEAGVGIAIDDFGTGYSSLSRLVTLPVSLLKIDRSFVAEVETDSGRAAVDVIVRLAEALGVEATAEGVETPQQLEILREAGVVSASGYLLGVPAPAESLAQLITST